MAANAAHKCVLCLVYVRVLCTRIDAHNSCASAQKSLDQALGPRQCDCVQFGRCTLSCTRKSARPPLWVARHAVNSGLTAASHVASDAQLRVQSVCQHSNNSWVQVSKLNKHQPDRPLCTSSCTHVQTNSTGHAVARHALRKEERE